jgi:hypothetical protein
MQPFEIGVLGSAAQQQRELKTEWVQLCAGSNLSQNVQKVKYVYYYDHKACVTDGEPRR